MKIKSLKNSTKPRVLNETERDNTNAALMIVISHSLLTFSREGNMNANLLF